jgi:hypothetical protein
MSELSPESRSLLATLAGAHDPPDDAAARVRAAINTRLASPPPPRRWPWAAGVSVAVGVLALALSRRPAPEPPPVTAAPTEVVTAAPSPPAPVTPPPVLLAPPAAVVAPAPTPRRPVVNAEDPMLAELRAVQTAQRALARRDGVTALRTLAALDRAQPQGNLREERDALRVLALCAAGRADEARAAADVFLSRHPGSPQATRVRGACR